VITKNTIIIIIIIIIMTQEQPTTSTTQTTKPFPPPIRPPTVGNGFDIHIYYNPTIPNQTESAKALYTKIQTRFPHLRVFKFWEQPIGPHSLPMFEVDLTTPEQFGEFVPWLLFERGDLSVLVHPQTSDGDRTDHTRHAMWMGEKVALNMEFLRD
jgi:DOPA 4,5-dioxygenase